MLATLTSKNQLTIPKKIIEKMPDTKYFDLEIEGNTIVMKPLTLYDTDDDEFIICALADKCDLIISGDKHLLDFGSYHNIEIITPAAFLTRNQQPQG